VQEDIEDESWWSPFVDGDDISVVVSDGIATLTGTVDTWAEREAATENALEGGATSAVNKLSVRHGPSDLRYSR
jgi:osmotically-inducible protein OsmY